MDLDILFYIAIAVFYLIAQMLGGRKRKPQPGPTRPPARRPAAPTGTGRSRAADAPPTPSRRDVPEPSPSSELEDALREIRTALGWETPQVEREPEPAPAPEPAGPERLEPTEMPRPDPIPKAKIESAREKKVPPARIETAPKTSATRAERTRKTVAQTPPFEWHERATSWDALSPVEKQRRPLQLPAKRQAEAQEQAQEKRLEDMRRRLHNPESARDAFILAEIFARRGRRF